MTLKPQSKEQSTPSFSLERRPGNRRAELARPLLRRVSRSTCSIGGIAPAFAAEAPPAPVVSSAQVDLPAGLEVLDLGIGSRPGLAAASASGRGAFSAASVDDDEDEEVDLDDEEDDLDDEDADEEDLDEIEDEDDEEDEDVEYDDDLDEDEDDVDEDEE